MPPTRIIHLPTIVHVLPDTACHHPGYHPQTQPTAPWQVYKDINLLAVVVAGISLTLHALAGSGGGALLGGAGEQGAPPPLGGTAAELGGELHKALRGIVERWAWAVVRMAETVEGCCGEQRLQVSCQTPDRDGHGYTRAERAATLASLQALPKDISSLRTQSHHGFFRCRSPDPKDSTCRLADATRMELVLAQMAVTALAP